MSRKYAAIVTVVVKCLEEKGTSIKTYHQGTLETIIIHRKHDIIYNDGFGGRDLPTFYGLDLSGSETNDTCMKKYFGNGIFGVAGYYLISSSINPNLKQVNSHGVHAHNVVELSRTQ